VKLLGSAAISIHHILFTTNRVKRWNNHSTSLLIAKQLEACFLPIGHVGGDTKPGRRMIALVFEAYGALCFFALAVFLAWAAVAKLRPDLDEEESDLVELEKLEKLVSSERLGGALSIEPPIIDEPSRSPVASPIGQSKRVSPMRRRPHLFHTRKPSTT
jgi:hypothetical protein